MAHINKKIQIKSKKKLYASIGIIIIVSILMISIFLLMNNSHNANKSAANALIQKVNTPCFTIDIPSNLKLLITKNSCNLSAVNASTGEDLNIQSQQNSSLTFSTLETAIKSENTKIVSEIPGGSIIGQGETKINGASTYFINIKSTSGKTTNLDFTYKSVAKNDMFSLLYEVKTNSRSNLSDIVNSWKWK
jgi:hypothetical protein